MKAKPMNSKKKKSKFNFASVLPYARTLYSNDACIECATQRKWYWSILFFFVSILIAMVPLTVTASKQNGSLFLANDTFGFKEAITETIEGNHFETVCGDLSSIKIENHQAKFVPNELHTSEIEKFANQQFYYLGYHESLYNNASQNNYQRDLDVYFVKDSEIEFEKINHLTTTMYKYLGQEKGVDYENDPHTESRTSSFMIIAKQYFSFGIYKQGGIAQKPERIFTGNFNHVDDTNFLDLLKANTDTLVGQEKNDAIFNNLKNFCDVAYHDNRTQLIWVQSGLSLGINGGLTLLLGVVVYLMTRGKQNPNRTIKFYQAMVLTLYASLTPAILSLIIGFIMPQFAVMLYVMAFGFRIMWMSMRSLRPQYN